MIKWHAIWAVIKGEPLNPDKTIKRNAGIGLLFIFGGAMLIVMLQTGKLPYTQYMIPIGVIEFCVGAFACYSWVIARNDKIRRNKLLVIQGKIFLFVIFAFTLWFISFLYSIAYPAPNVKTIQGGIGYSPGIIIGSILYFGRHISDFTAVYEKDTKKYTKNLLMVGGAIEVIVIFLFVQVIMAQ